jgi:hypothetical protein
MAAASNPVTAEPFEQTLIEALEDYSADETEGRRRLRQLVTRGGEGASRTCVAVLAGLEKCEASVYLAGLLIEGWELAPALCDPMLCSGRDAMHLMSIAMEADEGFDIRLLQHAVSMRPGSDAAISRVLGLLRRAAPSPRLLTALLLLMRHPTTNIRAEAAFLISRVKRSGDWVRHCLKDPDARVRAHAVEGYWGAASAEAIQVFREASRDEHHRVMANGLVGMHRAGLEGAAERLSKMGEREDPFFRSAAAWAMGECGCAWFEPALREMARSSDPMVKRCALRSLVRIRKAAQSGE